MKRQIAIGVYCVLFSSSVIASQCEESKATVTPKEELDRLGALIASEETVARSDIGAEGLYLLGRYYASNGKLESDFRKAIWLLRRSAEQGCIKATFALGVLTYGGKGIERDTKEGFRLALSAAEKGDVNAQLWVGMLFMDGSGENNKAGFGWIKKAADGGDSSAAIALAAAYLEGVGTERNPEATRSILEAVYKKQDSQAPTAAAYLGWMYMDGRGVPVDNIKALRWTAIAANHDVPGSKDRLRLLTQRFPEQKLSKACGVYMDAGLFSKEYWIAGAGERGILLSAEGGATEIFLPQRLLLGYVSSGCVNM